ncbi:MAG TPA: ECF-type sigma factor [Bryobacteraceae bacterium]|nr:ECF-type sigma factor [Bryobacteraceae bacterium]
MEPDPGKITELLKAWVAGDERAREELIPLVYSKLHHLAQHYRRNAGAGDTLQTTALVHEAYLRLVNVEGITWQDRAHFFAVSAQLMRRILVDAARAQAAAKRGGAQDVVNWLELDGLPAPDSRRAGELVALDDALTSLTQLDPRRASVVELRVFGGLTVDETAQALDLSPQSVMRDWKLAKAFLLRALSNQNTA